LAEAVAMKADERTATSVSLVYATGRSPELGPWVVTGTARAILGSTLYAFRDCLSGCGEGDTRHHEEVLVVVAPYSVWTSSSNDDGWFKLQPSDSSFSFASTTVEPGSSGTIGFVVPAWALVRFGASEPSDVVRTAANSEKVSRFATFTLDLVWTQGGAPELTLHRGELVTPWRQSPGEQSDLE
jgi:hypothetical protein